MILADDQERARGECRQLRGVPTHRDIASGVVDHEDRVGGEVRPDEGIERASFRSGVHQRAGVEAQRQRRPPDIAIEDEQEYGRECERDPATPSGLDGSVSADRRGRGGNGQ